MNIRKAASLGAMLVVVPCLLAGGASAADVAAPAGCSMSSLVSGGYNWARQDFKEDMSMNSKDYAAAFGEAGGLVNCGTLNVQLDGAYHDHQLEYDFGQKDAANAHLGGAIFARSDEGLFGAAGSWLRANHTSGREDIARFGFIGQHFTSDYLTLGGSIHGFNGGVVGTNHKGMELSAFTKLYASENLALKLQGDLLSASWEGDKVDGWALGAEVEYQLGETPFAFFGGGRYASRSFDFDDGADGAVGDPQGYVGLRLSFGGGMSLLARDRQGLVDNTSTFLEKLPNDRTTAADSSHTM